VVIAWRRASSALRCAFGATLFSWEHCRLRRSLSLSFFQKEERHGSIGCSPQPSVRTQQLAPARAPALEQRDKVRATPQFNVVVIGVLFRLFDCLTIIVAFKDDCWL
jgi:hypothetical protein